jgi:hypothetical protein
MSKINEIIDYINGGINENTRNWLYT